MKRRFNPHQGKSAMIMLKDLGFLLRMLGPSIISGMIILGLTAAVIWGL